MRSFLDWYWYKTGLKNKIILAVAVLLGIGYGFMGAYVYSLTTKILESAAEGLSEAERTALFDKYSPSCTSIIVVVVVLYVVSVVSAYYLTGNVSERLRKLARQAESIASGDLAGINRTSATDEIGAVENAVSVLSDRLNSPEPISHAEIRKYKADSKDEELRPKGNSDGKDVLKGAKVLLADDNALSRETIVKLLSGWGVHVETAESGRLAYDMFEDSGIYTYDFILMDARMPEMSGAETTKKIRAMNRLDAMKIPIIGLAANAYEEDVKKLIDAGMNDCLAKPIDVDMLFDLAMRYKGIYDLERYGDERKRA